MTRPQAAGVQGEQTVEWVLVREGWKITDRQVKVAGGHVADFVGIHPTYVDEWLIEVKVWGPGPSGKDTVKKAIADAYDLQQLGEPRPLLLIMSHRLDGLHGDMLRRAVRAGAINEVRVLGSTEHYGQDVES
jgi:hypothetical protein